MSTSMPSVVTYLSVGVPGPSQWGDIVDYCRGAEIPVAIEDGGQVIHTDRVATDYTPIAEAYPSICAHHHGSDREVWLQHGTAVVDGQTRQVIAAWDWKWLHDAERDHPKRGYDYSRPCDYPWDCNVPDYVVIADVVKTVGTADQVGLA